MAGSGMDKAEGETLHLGYTRVKVRAYRKNPEVNRTRLGAWLYGLPVVKKYESLLYQRAWEAQQPCHLNFKSWNLYLKFIMITFCNMHFIHRYLYVMYIGIYLPCFLFPTIDTFYKIVQVKNLRISECLRELSPLELCCAQAILPCKAVFIGD